MGCYKRDTNKIKDKIPKPLLGCLIDSYYENYFIYSYHLCVVLPDKQASEKNNIWKDAKSEITIIVFKSLLCPRASIYLSDYWFLDTKNSY